MLCKVTHCAGQDMFQPISLASLAESWELVSHVQNAVRWLAYDRQNGIASLYAAVPRKISMEGSH